MAFVPLSAFVPSPLTVPGFKGLYVVKWSVEGSNSGAVEEDIIFGWEKFLNKV